MKASELRIGNYYLSFGVDLKQVETLHKDKILIDFTPIPLTEEWLLKFGFEYYDTVKPKGYWLNGVCIEKIDSMLIEFKNGIGLKHVHQLQNLYFALTNKELTLKQN